MDEEVGAEHNDSEVEAGKSDSDQLPEPEPWVREELERIAEEARQMASEETGQVEESAADVGAAVEEARGQAEAAGAEVSGLVKDAGAAAEELGDEVVTTTGEEMAGLVDEAREAAAEPGESLERATVAAQAGMASATREARTAASEAHDSAEDVVRATRERIAVAEEMSMAPEYRGISFGDGFRFGCGFTVAGCLFWLILSIVLVAIPLVLSALNVIGLPGR